jgi:hypothetical protein
MLLDFQGGRQKQVDSSAGFLLFTLPAEFAKDAAGQEFIDLRMSGYWLTDPCCRILIPVVLTPMPNKDGTRLFNCTNKIPALHASSNSA